ncbi:MAG: sugar nucleotide-binding protein [Nitrospirales bacterium]
MKPRLLVTGGAGFLGRHLLLRARHFAATGTLHRTAAMAIPEVTFHVCDLQQPHEVRILLDRVRPDMIIHTACSDQDGNLSAIASVAGILALESAERHIRFIHLSTDQVFDGTAAPYTETCTPCPIHAYGQAKTQAEDLVRSLNPQATIVRTSLLYDLRSPDRQTRQLIQTIQTGEPYSLFTDEFRCPVWVENLGEVLLELAGKDYAGILHLGGPERLNRWDFGMKLLAHFGITPTPHIQQGTIEESGLIRPKDLTMESTCAQQTLHTPLLSFDAACKTDIPNH